jgi:hypothetical protein
MFQYNLRSLMLVMLGVCLLTWLLFVLPGEIGVIVLMCGLTVVPSAVVAGILYFRGYPQAFAIGCVPPVLLIGSILLFEGLPWGYGPNDTIQIKIMILVSLLVVIAGGAASAGIRRLAVGFQQQAAQLNSLAREPASSQGSQSAEPGS